MKISYKWLREYVNTKIRPQKLADILTMAGLEVTAYEQVAGDDIFEIEITPNRPDWLSHIGVAREVAVLQGKVLDIPEVSVAQEVKESVKVTIKDSEACPFYSARVISDVKIGPSPKWLREKIEAVGLRSVNNVVDITNFVMLETGQPLHAFDLAKLSEKEIFVRNARKGEKLLLIDGTQKDLTERSLLITDGKKPLALAGIMGGKGSEIGNSTKDILLECAVFNPYGIRKTVQELGVASDSSYRFERGVDPGAVSYSSDRAASLIADICKGKIGLSKTAGSSEKKISFVSLECAKANEALGTDLSSAEMRRILKGLGFDVKGSSFLEVKVPSYRIDVEREADLIEEIARVYGYDNIPLSVPEIVVTDEKPDIKDARKKKDIVKDVLRAAGYCETITYSLVSKDIIKKARIPEQGLINIRNPLSKEQEVMRSSLFPGALKVVS
ncbi:MAG: phenylalanine--tRNA ligase subunit beta, partial [Candidatus Omnitrophota bacterium]